MVLPNLYPLMTPEKSVSVSKISYVISSDLPGSEGARRVRMQIFGTLRAASSVRPTYTAVYTSR